MILKRAIQIEYMSNLETLEGFSNALARCSKHRIGAWGILYPLVKLLVLGIARGSQQGALFTLSQLLSMPYRWITRVL